MSVSDNAGGSGSAPSNRKFGFVIKSNGNVNLEEYLIAVGNIIGDKNITDAGKIYSNVGIWVRDDEAAAKLKIMKTIEIGNETLTIWPYINPIKKVKLISVPPYINNEAITEELKKYGQIKGAMHIENMYGVSGRFAHIRSYTRTIPMSFKKDEKIPDKITITAEGEVSTIIVQVGKPKCFVCSSTQHKSSDCDKKKNNNNNTEPTYANALRNRNQQQQQLVRQEENNSTPTSNNNNTVNMNMNATPNTPVNSTSFLFPNNDNMTIVDKNPFDILNMETDEESANDKETATEDEVDKDVPNNIKIRNKIKPNKNKKIKVDSVVHNDSFYKFTDGTLFDWAINDWAKIELNGPVNNKMLLANFFQKLTKNLNNEPLNTKATALQIITESHMNELHAMLISVKTAISSRNKNVKELVQLVITALENEIKSEA